MNMTTSSASRRQTIGGFTFDYVEPGTYLRPVVTYREDALNLERLWEAYQSYLATTGLPNDWTLSPATEVEQAVLDVGLWVLIRIDAQGQPHEIDEVEPSDIDGVSQTEANVRLHIVGRDERGQPVRVIYPSDYSGVCGVLELIYNSDLDLIAQTFDRAGLGNYCQYDDLAKRLITSFDVVIHDTATLTAPGTDAPTLLSKSSTTTRSTEFAAQSVATILARQLHLKSIMNTQTTSSSSAPPPSVSASLSDKTPGEIADMYNRLAASATTTSSVAEDASPQLTVLEDFDHVYEHHGHAGVTLTSASTAGEMSSVQTAGGLQPAKTADTTHFGKHAVDVSRLFPDGNTRGRQSNKDKHRKPTTAAKLVVPEGLKVPVVARDARVTQMFGRLAQQVTAKVIDPAQDGIEHVNILQGKTKFGRSLDPNANLGFNLGELGQFASIGALWVYLRANEEERQESWRTLHGTRARHMGKRHSGPEFPGFRQMIAEATWIKINTWPDLVKDIVGNDLPFRMYYINDGEVQDNPISAWYLPILEEIAKTLKAISQGAAPDLAPDWSILTQQRHGADRDRRRNERTNSDRPGSYGRPYAAPQTASNDDEAADARRRERSRKQR